MTGSEKGRTTRIGSSQRTTVNYYALDCFHFKGTKVMCNEGGCGCCVVALTKADPLTRKKITLAVNSVRMTFCISKCCLRGERGEGKVHHITYSTHPHPHVLANILVSTHFTSLC